MVVEIKHVAHGPLDEKQSRAVSESVKETLPIRDDGEERTVTFIGVPDGSIPQSQTTQMKVTRWSSRDRRTVLTIRADTLSLETTLYYRYASIKQLLEHALRALADTVDVAGVTRIGLRYIDEIRVPSENDSGLPKWDEWVDASLLGPSGVDVGYDLAFAANEGTAVFSGKNEERLVLRYGAQDTYVVGSTPQLRRPLPSPGPLFKLDIDSYWEPDDVPEFDPDTILKISDELHGPVRSIFEGSITDKLRDEVLRRA